jgi:3-oxoacyl-[acyl-carrier-protein] synthase II
MVRVAVTGIGIRCAAADDAKQFWQNVIDGRSGVIEVTGLELGDSPCRIGGQITTLAATGSGADAVGARLSEMLRGVVEEALHSSGLALEEADPTRVGLTLGQCQGALADEESAHFMHECSDAIANHLGITGPRTVISTACTAGAAALALAAERIVGGEVDVMLAGGADVLSSFTWRGFTSLQSLSPDGCAPYSRSAGLVLGEGAGILVLEPLERVLAQGRTPLAELLGWGFSADAHHITAPDATGRGALLAMERAVSRAGFGLDKVDYVCGHGTGTQANDEMEVKALRLAFGERAPLVPLSSIKPMIGHTLGAAGAIEAAASVYALRDGMLPPTVNFTPTGVDSDLDFVPNVTRQAPLRVVMTNNYAFGGNNSSLVFGRVADRATVPTAPPTYRDVCVTGIGIVSSLGSGYPQWSAALLAGHTGLRPFTLLDPGSSGLTIGAELPELSSRGVTTPGEWRHLDPLSRLALTVSRQAWTDSGLRLTPGQRNNVAVIYGSGTGPVSAIRRFQDSVASGDPSPMHFPNTVYTAAPGHVCKALALRGPTTTFTSGGVAGMHAIEYATALVARGEVDQALVIAVDELSEWHLGASGEQRNYLSPGLGVPFQRGSKGANLGAAGVALVIEATEHAQDRGARRYGRILGTAVGGDAIAGMLPDPRGSRWSLVLRQALRNARVEPAEVGYVACAANGATELDSLETGVINRILGPKVPVSAPKSMTGETLGASGGIALVSALVALQTGLAPPTAGLTDPVGGERVHHVMGEPAAVTGDAAVANVFSLGGNYGAVVVGR